jgi:hypothetical protein
LIGDEHQVVTTIQSMTEQQKHTQDAFTTADAALAVAPTASFALISLAW